MTASLARSSPQTSMGCCLLPPTLAVPIDLNVLAHATVSSSRILLSQVRDDSCGERGGCSLAS